MFHGRWLILNGLATLQSSADMPIAVFVHICSTKVPYKTVGKEFIADRSDVEREVINAVREVARRLSLFLSKKIHLARISIGLMCFRSIFRGSQNSRLSSPRKESHRMFPRY